jgi:glycosyltransferase involved in cell wall biosynthesis
VLRPITARYLIAISVPTYQDEAGHRYVESLWYKDLKEHLTYLKCLTLACPIDRGELPSNCISIQDELAAGLKLIDLPNPNSFLKGLLSLPAVVQILWSAIGRSDIVHTSVAGWPMPLGWIAIPIARLRRKLSVVIVESAFWRISIRKHVPLRRRGRAWVSECLNRWCVTSASLSIFTQDQYRKSLLGKESKRGHVISASWIDERDILEPTHALEIWQRKTPGKLRVLFAGRLVSDKGVLVLLNAMKRLEIANVKVELDILGEGELFEVCYKASVLPASSINIKMLGTIAYGDEFKRMIQGYHAMVVPSITDEQPRIVYDAYSQAVPVLGSNTDGLRACVVERETGRLVTPGDPLALAELLQWSSENIGTLESMGLAALSTALSLTHQEMHKRRWSLLENLTGNGPNRGR